MELDKELSMALEVCLYAHEGQKRKNGLPYVIHPIRVAFACSGTLYKIVALLHDVVEDTEIDMMDLDNYGFRSEVLEAVDILTKKGGKTYKSYIQGCCKNEIARVVKIFDIRDNLHDMDALDANERNSMSKRYNSALKILIQYKP